MLMDRRGRVGSLTWITGFYHRLSTFDPLLAKLWATCADVELASSYDKVIVESDSATGRSLHGDGE